MTRPLRVVIDLRPLALSSVTGVGLVISQILSELRGREIAFMGISDRPVPPGRVDATIPIRVAPATGGRIRWEWRALPRLLRELDPPPDLYHATWNHGVPARLAFPSVVTIHDLIPWHLPTAVPWPRPAALHRWLYRRAVRDAVRHAAAITTVSETSRRDLVGLFPGMEDKVRVVPNALPRWFRRASGDVSERARGRWAGGRPYVLYLGGFDPRKDVPTLLRAMAAAFPRRDEAPEVVLAGERNAIARACEALAQDLGIAVRFPGHVGDRDIPEIFAGASVFVYPSRAEGFGFPLLFAMASGVPTIASDAGSLPEVLGDAGLFFPAGDAGALATLLRRAADDPAFLAPSAARGPDRANRFSPDVMAEALLRVYERGAGSRGGSR